jgi:hypothetical protein
VLDCFRLEDDGVDDPESVADAEAGSAILRFFAGRSIEAWGISPDGGNGVFERLSSPLSVRYSHGARLFSQLRHEGSLPSHRRCLM